jgi:hypothetical protein
MDQTLWKVTGTRTIWTRRENETTSGTNGRNDERNRSHTARGRRVKKFPQRSDLFNSIKQSRSMAIYSKNI